MDTSRDCLRSPVHLSKAELLHRLDERSRARYGEPFSEGVLDDLIKDGLVPALDRSKNAGLKPVYVASALHYRRAASEGLEVIVLDCRAFGGQAGASSRIENYLGFPTGISGMALMARAYNQAQKFGAEMVIPDQAHQLSERIIENSKSYFLTVGDDESLRARAVVVASGALSTPRCAKPRTVRRIIGALLGLPD